jgi:hypothetical protein
MASASPEYAITGAHLAENPVLVDFPSRCHIDEDHGV